jgi:hypothetical protein
VHGHGGLVVDPEDVLALEVAARLDHEAAGGRGALVRLDARQRSRADVRCRGIAHGAAQQNRRVRDGAALLVEHPQTGFALVEDHERQALVVRIARDPLQQLAGRTTQGGRRGVRGVQREQEAEGKARRDS